MAVTIEIRNHVPYRIRVLTAKVIYEATVVNNSDDEKQVYFSASDTTFKD